MSLWEFMTQADAWAFASVMVAVVAAWYVAEQWS